MTTNAATPEQAGGAPNPRELLRSKSYIVLLVFGALVGVPTAVVAYFFLKLVAEAQQYLFATLPLDLGFDDVPTWWPVLPLVVGGLLVGLIIQYLPGTGGHEPSAGFVAGGSPSPIELPGIALAAFATLAFGAVLGPEAPLIAIGSGLGVLAVHLIKKDAPRQAIMVIGAAGSFAAISTLLGSPIVGAFLLMEAAGLGGPLMGVVLAPGLLAAGIGSLIFIGLDNWTGFGTFSLAVPDIPPFTTPTVAEFAWAVAIGVLSAVLGSAIRRLALVLQPHVARRRVLMTTLAGLVVGLSVVVFDGFSDHAASNVLFSGQDALGPLIQQASTWTVGALVLLIVCKGVAYGVSLSGFRGGPTFPGMFIGAAFGLALSHLPGLSPIAGIGMGIGAMTVVMLGLPLTSVLLATLFLQADGLGLMPLIIVAVVVAYVAAAHLEPIAGPRGQAAAVPTESPPPTAS